MALAGVHMGFQLILLRDPVLYLQEWRADLFLPTEVAPRLARPSFSYVNRMTHCSTQPAVL